MDGHSFLGVDGSSFVNRLSNNIDNSSKSLGAHGNHDGVAGIGDFLPSDETLGGVQGNRAHVVASQVLRHF